MTDTFDAVEAVETPAIAEIVPPVEAPVEQPEEVKQDEPKFTKAEVEQKVQERLAKAERKHEREHRQRLEAEVAALRQQNAPKEVEAPGKPDRKDYADDVTFVEDLAGWKANQKFAEMTKQREQETRQQTQQRELADIVRAHEKRVEAVKVSNPDYDDVVNADDLNISKAMAEAIVLSENGPKVALYLANNPSEADRIAKMHPSLAGYELGKLEAKISAPTAKTISNAPAPLSTVASTKAITADLENASQEEYEKLRKKQGARWA